MAIGARSQSARTYLEKHYNTFLDCDLNDLVAHGLRALRDTLPNEVDLNTKVCETSCMLVNLTNSVLTLSFFFVNFFNFFFYFPLYLVLTIKNSKKKQPYILYHFIIL